MMRLLQTVNTTKLDLIYLILACVGILIILACIGSYLFRYGQGLRDRVQEIKAFGADLRISVITVFILVGVALIIPSVWKSFNDTVESLNQSKQSLETEYKKLEKERDQFKVELETAKAKQLREQTLLLELEGINKDQFPQKENLSVGYYDVQSENPQLLSYDIVSDGKVKRIKITFQNVNNETEYPRLEIIHDKQPVTKWIFENFKPADTRVIVLKKEIQ